MERGSFKDRLKGVRGGVPWGGGSGITERGYKFKPVNE